MRVSCQVISCNLVNHSTHQIMLKPADDLKVFYEAGQYLNLLLPDGKPCSFSIASNCKRTNLLELHILEIPGQSSSGDVISLLSSQNTVKVELPFGDCTLSNLPALQETDALIFIAAGTGFAQVKSLLDEVVAESLPNPVYLYYGVRKAADFYLQDLVKGWREAHPAFNYVPVVSEADEACQWQGRTGLLHEIIREDFEHLESAQVFLSGSPLMVYATLDVLIEHGLDEARAYSDVFSYAPRDR